MRENIAVGRKFTLHHTGVLVRDIERTADHYISSMGFRLESPVIDDSIQTARVMFLRLPGSLNWLELIAPLGSNSKLSSAMVKGGGIHHICYEVDDLVGALSDLRASKWMVVCDPVPAAAFPGRRIAWAMDRQRLLVELLESGLGPLSLSSLRRS